MERLADLNPVPGPITLRSDRAEFDVYFNLSTRIDPVSARLHLQLSNSQALLAGRSQIVLRLNDAVVGQVALRPDSPMSSLDVDLPVELLRGGGNKLNLAAAQHYTNECENPGAAELWSQIDTTRSHIAVTGRPVMAAPVLSDLQELIGPGFFGGREFMLMTPGDPGRLPDAAVASGATLSQALALRLRYQPVVVTVAAAQDDGGSGNGLHLAPSATSAPLLATGVRLPDIVLFGTVDALKGILGPDIARAVTGGFIGVYALPADPSRLVILVSGRSEEDLARGVAAFGVTNFPFVDAPQQVVDGVEVQSAETFFANSLVQEGRKTSFAELGLPTTTLRGTSGRIGLDVVLPPDLYLADSTEAELALEFAYGAGLRTDSVVNVLIDGEFQQAIPLPDRNGAVLRDYRIRIPSRKLKPGRNRLEFEAIMTPLVTGACLLTETRNQVLTLSDASTITVAQGSRLAAQPDLHLFAATGYPYVGSGGYDLALSARDPATVSAAWTLSARLAQLAGRMLTEQRVRVGAPEVGRHAIVVGAVPDLPPAIASAGPVGLGQPGSYPYASSAALVLAEPPSWWQAVSGLVGSGAPPAGPAAPASVVKGMGGLGRNGLLLASEAPGGGNFTLTRVTAANPEALRAAVQTLVRPPVWPHLAGDVALWRPAASGTDVPPTVSTQRVGPTYHIGSFRSANALRYLVGEYPWIWLGAIVVAVLLLVGLLRLLLVSRLRRVHPGSGEGIP